MIDILLHIGMGCILSFVASIPFGMINLYVANVSLQKGFRTGLKVAAGAAFVESLQGFLSVQFGALLLRYSEIEHGLQLTAPLIFVTIGTYFFLKKQQVKQIKPKAVSHSFFFKGMGITSLNILAYPFWIFIAGVLSANGWLQHDIFSITAFTVGILLGSFALFAAYAKLADTVLTGSTFVQKNSNKIIGVFLFTLALIQVIRLGL
jgi:threonine/homoserine/homoserine lactone efflux protein